MPESFHGASLPVVMQRVRDTLGPDAMILRTAVRPGRGGDVVEIVAAKASEVESLRSRLRGPETRPRDADPASGRREPRRIALVGPGGAGKTTALVKLALAASRESGGTFRRPGILTLDTWNAGALEELRTWSEVLDVPLEVMDSPEEMDEALATLAHCDTLFIDTPGCGHGTPEARRNWWPSLEALRPHEIHVAIPAGMRIDVARAAMRALEPLEPSHLLITQVDAVPGESGLMDLARALDRPVRWLTDSPEHSTPVKPAEGRMLSALALDVRGAQSGPAAWAPGVGPWTYAGKRARTG